MKLQRVPANSLLTWLVPTVETMECRSQSKGPLTLQRYVNMHGAQSYHFIAIALNILPIY